eukprot:9975271-Heterocapsa_arctica.AAC.1
MLRLLQAMRGQQWRWLAALSLCLWHRGGAAHASLRASAKDAHAGFWLYCPEPAQLKPCKPWAAGGQIRSNILHPLSHARPWLTVPHFCATY